MKQAKYEKAKELKERMLSLEVFSMYLTSMFKHAPMGVQVDVSVGVTGQKISQPFNTKPYNPLSDSSDEKYLIDKIKERITEIEKEFYEL